jgi:selenocysteine-specific elongation factor
LTVRDGRVVRIDDGTGLPPSIAEAIEKLQADLGAAPFAAPDAARLAELRLGPRELAAATRAGALVRVAEGVVLLPGSVERSVSVLAALTQPFTVSEAKQALGTTRRVAVPLLELLDRRRLTERLPDDRRRVRTPE